MLRLARRRQPRPLSYAVDVALDALVITVALAMFVGLLWWGLTVASS